MPVTEHPGATYDFLSEENYPRWSGLLQPFLKGVLHEVHPRLEIEVDALTLMEKLLYQLLQKICAISPCHVQDVKDYVQETYPHPVNEWAVQEAEGSMDKFSKRKKGRFVLPIDKIHHLLSKEVLKHKLDMNVTCFILGVLDYVAADALKVAGNFMKNFRDRSQDSSRGGVIVESELRLSLNVDQALNDLFELNSDHEHGILMDPMYSPDAQQSKLDYEDYVKRFNSEEAKYLSHLNMLIKIYKETFMKMPELFTNREIEILFGNLDDMYDLTMQLHWLVEDSLDKFSDGGGDQSKDGCPQIGACFAEVAETGDFTVYSQYCEHIHAAIDLLKTISKSPHLDKLTPLQPSIPLFKESVIYVLPTHLLQPVYHCLYYFDMIQVLMKMSKSEDDKEQFLEAYSAMLGVKRDIDRVVADFPLKKSREDPLKLTSGYHANIRKLHTVQQSIDMWEGPSISVLCTEYLMEGTLGFLRDASRTTKRTDRHVFLLNGLIICCKQNTRRSSSGVVTPEWRLKEKLTVGKVELKDFVPAEFPDCSLAFELKEKNQPGYVFIAANLDEKMEWMGCLTHLLSRSSFERKLTRIGKEEERNALEIRPSPQEYRFAEEDSDKNIMFEQRDGIPIIKGGTVLKLVERLTHDNDPDPYFLRIFMTTFRSFCSPSELLLLLIERFNVTLPAHYEDPECKRDFRVRDAIGKFKMFYQSPIQMRVLNTIRYWAEHHFYDFQKAEGNGDLLKTLQEFLETISSSKLRKYTDLIRRTMQRQKEGADVPQVDSSFYNKSPPVEWHLSRDPLEFDLLSLSPLELARQLTLLEADYFKAIHPSELVGCAWTKSNQEETTPNYRRMVRHSTAITYWLEQQVVSAQNQDERLAVITRCCDLYMAFEDLKNFCGMFEVHAALMSSAVFRLEHTLKNLNPRKHSVLQEGKELIELHYKKYKEKLRCVDPPCVPFLGMYLSDITFIEVGGKSTIPNTNLINFGYRRKVAEVIRDIQQYQTQPYCLQLAPSIQNFIRKISPLDGFKSGDHLESHLFDLSLDIEPRNKLPKKYPRATKWDLKSPGHKPSKQEQRKRNQSVPSILDPDSSNPPVSPGAPLSPPPTDAHSKRSSTISENNAPSSWANRRSSDIGNIPTKASKLLGPGSGSLPSSPTRVTVPEHPDEEGGVLNDKGPLPPLPPKPPPKPSLIEVPPLPKKENHSPSPGLAPDRPPLPPREPNLDLPPPLPSKGSLGSLEELLSSSDLSASSVHDVYPSPPPIPSKEPLSESCDHGHRKPQSIPPIASDPYGFQEIIDNLKLAATMSSSPPSGQHLPPRPPVVPPKDAPYSPFQNSTEFHFDSTTESSLTPPLPPKPRNEETLPPPPLPPKPDL